MKRHGMTGTGAHKSWCAMLARCKPGHHAYRNYGGRGITICDRWKVFENFLDDMGQRPEGFSLDRIDNDGNYEPGNCRWANSKTQNNNKRRPLPYILNFMYHKNCLPRLWMQDIFRVDNGNP